MTDLPRAWTITVPLPTWGMNLERSEHWRVHRARTREYRTTACLLARAARIPTLDRVAIEITPIGPSRTGDVAFGCAPAAKAAIDGLVDARVLPDDTPKHVTFVGFHPKITGAAGLHLLIVDLADEAPYRGSYAAKLALDA